MEYDITDIKSLMFFISIVLVLSGTIYVTTLPTLQNPVDCPTENREITVEVVHYPESGIDAVEIHDWCENMHPIFKCLSKTQFNTDL